MRGPLRNVLCAALSLLVVAGCGSRHELKVRFPAESKVDENATVFVDGIEAGYIESLTPRDDGVLVTVVIKDKALAKTRIKQGLTAYTRDDGGVDLDASEVAADAVPLASGTTIEGRQKEWLQDIIRQYTAWQTIAAAAIGLLALLVLVWLFRAIFRLGAVVVVVLLAFGASWILHPLATPLVQEHLYPRIEKQRQPPAVAPQPEPAPATTTPVVATAPGTAEPSDAERTAERVAAPVKHAAAALESIPLPHPKWVAFFGCWIASFVVLQIVLGYAFRATRAKK